MSTIITGASGKLGRLSVEALLERLDPEQVIATTRHPDDLADLAARGVSVRFADFDDPESLVPAFEGGDRILLISATNATGARMDQHGAAIDAARAAGVEHLVFTSMPRVDDVDHPTGLLAEEYRDSEALVRASGLPWTMLRNAPYTELHIVERMQDAIRAGEIVSNAVSGGVSFISRRDCAATAAAVLTTEGHQGMSYDVTGPAAITYDELAAAAAAATGHPVRFTRATDQEIREGLAQAGVPEMFAEMFVGWGPAVQRGYYSDVTDVVERLTGTPPASVVDVLTAHRNDLLEVSHA